MAVMANSSNHGPGLCSRPSYDVCQLGGRLGGPGSRNWRYRPPVWTGFALSKRVHVESCEEVYARSGASNISSGYLPVVLPTLFDVVLAHLDRSPRSAMVSFSERFWPLSSTTDHHQVLCGCCQVTSNCPVTSCLCSKKLDAVGGLFAIVSL
jgi:hypothetical protein